MAKKISILGSTGSIGTQTLDVARNLNIEVVGLAVDKNIDLLEKQIIEFKPSAVAVNDKELAKVLKEKVKDKDVQVYSGLEGIIKIATMDEADTVVTSMVGIAGLMPTIEAIKAKKNIALANKETLVTAGAIIMREAKKNGVNILPVDSEHSAIFQSLMGNNKTAVAKILLTASGGPFRKKNKKELEQVTVEEALKHPNWDMGCKITIDSATLMNKGLEMIEAKWLFDMEPEKIEVLVHPQSIVHSMVEFIDGSVIAQLGSPDMRLPIQFSLTYPERVENNFPKLDLLKIGRLTFEEPDYEKFPCLGLAFRAVKCGGSMPAAMNAANEEAVALFLNRKIGFADIPRIIKRIMDMHDAHSNPDIEKILEIDLWARNTVKSIL